MYTNTQIVEKSINSLLYYNNKNNEKRLLKSWAVRTRINSALVSEFLFPIRPGQCPSLGNGAIVFSEVGTPCFSGGCKLMQQR